MHEFDKIYRMPLKLQLNEIVNYAIRLCSSLPCCSSSTTSRALSSSDRNIHTPRPRSNVTTASVRSQAFVPESSCVQQHQQSNDEAAHSRGRQGNIAHRRQGKEGKIKMRVTTARTLDSKDNRTHNSSSSVIPPKKAIVYFSCASTARPLIMSH